MRKKNAPRFQESSEAAAQACTLHACSSRPDNFISFTNSSLLLPLRYTTLLIKWMNHAEMCKLVGFISAHVIVRWNKGTCSQAACRFLWRCPANPPDSSAHPHFLSSHILPLIGLIVLWCVSFSSWMFPFSVTKQKNEIKWNKIKKKKKKSAFSAIPLFFHVHAQYHKFLHATATSPRYLIENAFCRATVRQCKSLKTWF